MSNRTPIKNGRGALAAIIVLSLLAACGEGDDESAASSGEDSGLNLGAALACFAYLLVSGNDECIGYGSSSPSSSGGFSSGTRYVINPDVEPNNDWLTSNHLIIENTASPDGFTVDGEISDVTDVADTFSLARRTSRNFRFKLCAPSQFQCTEYGAIDTLTAYIDILDSSGRVVASSQGASWNFVSTRINAGVTYYVRVAAGDTMAATVGYKLMAQEFE
jgi:hypothetical protein